MATAKPDYRVICELTADDTRYDELERVLIAGSNLPGPRANLTLAAAFADCIAAEGATEPQWTLLTEWLAIAEDEAPSGSPREFLPFSAAQAHGAAYPASNRDRRVDIVARLREVANDGRWRIREAVTLALQRIGEWDFSVLIDSLEAWLPDAAYLELRAIVAALAHPPLLRSPENARSCLAVTERVVSKVIAVDDTDRTTDEFVALKKGLGFAPSLFVAALPDEGFPMLERWARSGDRDLAWIVRENLKKNRLSRTFAAEVSQVAAALG
ncbi:MAG TPA: hypothetical protein VKB09_05440 [Thermomicrobiales bacterium]|nr:hypothetical protein [Thermomicrobiales bacterium]